MGYPIDKIGPETRLFSLIGANAIESGRESLFNNAFQQLDADCKMMPLNIREDDLGFFLHGLKNSKINGAYLEREYWKSVFDLLGEGDHEVQTCGICDTITIQNNQYRFELTQGKATLSYLENLYGNLSDKSVTIIGATQSSKSFLIHLIQQKPNTIMLASPIVEELLELSALIPDNISHDIIRIQDGTIHDKSDITVNFEEKPVSAQNGIYLDFNRDFDKILQQIANIKTKEWSL